MPAPGLFVCACVCVCVMSEREGEKEREEDVQHIMADHYLENSS